jgi:hypothetical protein
LSLLKVFFQVAKTCFAVFLDESALVSNAVCVVLVYVLAVEIENGVFDSEIVGDRLVPECGWFHGFMVKFWRRGFLDYRQAVLVALLHTDKGAPRTAPGCAYVRSGDAGEVHVMQGLKR